MCTVSWLHQPTGFLLLSNRDEKRTRKPALPPRIAIRDGVRYISPTDGDHRGSWIAVNEFGLAITLLNGNVQGKSKPDRSRGLLVLDWVTARTSLAIAELFEAATLTCYAPFTVAVLHPGHKTQIHRWNGKKKTTLESPESNMPLTSSSLDPAGAQVHRRMEFRRLLSQSGQVDEKLLRQFHTSHGAAEPSALTVCMHRDDAETVSFARIQVDTTAVRFFYSPSAPCKNASGVEIELPRQ